MNTVTRYRSRSWFPRIFFALAAIVGYFKSPAAHAQIQIWVSPVTTEVWHEGSTERVWVPPVMGTRHVEEVSHIEHIPEQFHWVHHPEVSHMVHHDAVYEVIHHELEIGVEHIEEVSHIVHHPAQTHTECVDGYWDSYWVDDYAWVCDVYCEWIYDYYTEGGWWECWEENCREEWVGGHDEWYWVDGYCYEVTDQEAWDEKVIDVEEHDNYYIISPAYNEYVLISEARDEKVVDRAAYDEKVVDAPARDVKVVDVPAHDEEYVVEEGRYETVQHPGWWETVVVTPGRWEWVAGNPSNLKINADAAALFISWTNSSHFSFDHAVIAWSTGNDLNSALADPSRHATTTHGYFSIEGLTDNTTYNVWVLGRSIHGRLSTGNITGTAMPSVPLGFKYTPDQVLAATAVETTTGVETAVVNTEKAIVEKSSTSSVGPTLRAILTKLSAALHTAITPIIYTAKVHEAARHIAILIAREAYLNGEITAEQYIIIGEYIRDQLVLPPVGMAQGEAQHNVQLATAAVVQKINEAKAENQNWERSTAVIHRFGSSPTPQNPEKLGVSPARPLQDFGLPVDSPGTVVVGPENLPLPKGASAFGNINATSLTGHYWTLGTGRVIPPVIGIVADGNDVNLTSTHGPTHYTIYPKVPMSLDVFNGLLRTLGWTYGGRKTSR